MYTICFETPITENYIPCFIISNTLTKCKTSQPKELMENIMSKAIAMVSFICELAISYPVRLLQRVLSINAIWLVRHNAMLSLAIVITIFNTLIGTLKPQNNDDWYTGRPLVDRYIWYSEEGTRRAPSNPLLPVPNLTAHPSTVSVPTSYFLM